MPRMLPPVISAIVLAALCCLLVLIASLLSGEQVNYEELHTAARRLGSSLEFGSDLGTPKVLIDFYRTYKVQEIPGVWSYKDYVITKTRLQLQVAWVNMWYQGRVKFVLGNFYEVENPMYLERRTDCFDVLNAFQEDAKAANRYKIAISVLIVPSVNANGCAKVDIPLGGELIFRDGELDLVVPTVVVGMESTTIASIPKVGIQNVLGLTLAHEIGHIMGFTHTMNRGEEFVDYYFDFDCQLFLEYPVWSSDTSDNVVYDEISGVEYYYEDWKGRTNIMAGGAGVSSVICMPWELSLFSNQYGEVFGQMLECWVQRSGFATTNNTNSGN